MDQRFYNLYDEYIHGFIERRSFLDRLGRLAGSTAAASVVLPLLENNMARAETVAETDARISGETVVIPGVPGLKGYLVKPKGGKAKKPAVIVIHENRGLNPHIKDVTRRFATEGFVALGVDYLSPIGGTPADQDQGAKMIGTLKPEDVVASSRAALAYLKSREDVNGKVGAVGFCWGGGAVNDLAVADPNLNAAVPYYGRQPPADKVAQIKAPILAHYAGMDERIDAGIPAFEAALKADKKRYQIFVYDGAQHGFNNDTSEARYNKPVADLAWKRTVDFFKKELA
jgi:carboxymethylenebutenolidase